MDNIGDKENLIPIIYIHNDQWMFYMNKDFEILPQQEKLSLLDQLEDWVKSRRKYHKENKD